MNNTEFQKAAEDKILKLMEELNPLEKNLLYRQLNRGDGLSMDGIDHRIEKLSRELASKATSFEGLSESFVLDKQQQELIRLVGNAIAEIGKITCAPIMYLPDPQLSFQFPSTSTSGTYTIPTIVIDAQGNVSISTDPKNSVSFM